MVDRVTFAFATGRVVRSRRVVRSSRDQVACLSFVPIEDVHLPNTRCGQHRTLCDSLSGSDSTRGDSVSRVVTRFENNFEEPNSTEERFGRTYSFQNTSSTFSDGAENGTPRVVVEVDTPTCWKLFSQAQPRVFPRLYAAYRHFRLRGWIPKSGAGSGGDLILECNLTKHMRSTVFLSSISLSYSWSLLQLIASVLWPTA